MSDGTGTTTDAAFNPPDAEAWALIDALLEGRSTVEGRRQLHGWVTAHPEVARNYARAAHQRSLLPRTIARPQSNAALLAQMTTGADPSLGEAMIMPALHEADEVADEPVPMRIRVAPAPVRPTPSRWRWWAGAGVATAAAAAAALIVTTRSTPLPVPTTPSLDPTPAPLAIATPPVVPVVPVRQAVARITASAGAVWDRVGAAPVPGAKLFGDDAFEISQGGVELTFESGAVAVIAAPSRVRLVDRNRMELETGSLTANVPPPAIGFTVVSPGLSVVDRGTMFGVRTAEDNRASEVAVFKGKVDAAGANADQATLVKLVAGQSVTHAVGGTGAPVATPYSPDTYLHDIRDLRLPVPSHGTGQGLATGAPDPFWQVIAVPDQPDWKPRQAFVAVVDPARLAPNAPTANWIAIDPHMPEAASGEYQLRTTIDLTGFDPATATVAAGLVGEGQVTDILVNGTSTSSRNPPLGNRTPRSPPRRWTLEGAPWHAGANEIVVDVLKRAPNRAKVGPLGLQLSWDVKARPTVQR